MIRPAPDEPARCRELFDALVGRRTGIIRELALVDRAPGDAELFFAGARIANFHPQWGDHHGLWVGGCGGSAEAALIAAMAEGVERYSASSYPSPGRLAARRDLDGPSLAPDRIAAYSTDQRMAPGFPYPDVDDGVPVRWVPGRRLQGGGPCHVPAQAVYVLYQPQAGEPGLCPGLSTGLACAASREAAIHLAVCEIIERDAMALTWLLGISPPRIPADLLRAVAGDLLPARDAVSAFDLTGDLGVPVMMVLAVGGGDLVSVGTAASPDPVAALRKAAREASQTRVYVRRLIERQPQERRGPGHLSWGVTDFSRHARLYSGRPRLARKALRFLWDNPQPPPSFAGRGPELAARDARSLIDLPARRGLDGAWVDLTPPWAGDLGLSVVRVVIPGLLPLHGHESLAALGHPRLAGWRRAMPHGRRGHRRQRWPFPHPFP